MRVIYRATDDALGETRWWTSSSIDRTNRGPMTWDERYCRFPTREAAQMERHSLLHGGGAAVARIVSDEEYRRLCLSGEIRNPFLTPEEEREIDHHRHQQDLDAAEADHLSGLPAPDEPEAGCQGDV